MTNTEKALILTAIERLIDRYGWAKIIDGIVALCDEYYEGETAHLTIIRAGMAMVKDALTARCPDAPGSR